MPHSLSRSALSLTMIGALAVAACGGTSTPPPSPAAPPAAGGDDPATPFDDAAVKAAIAGTPRSSAPACGDAENVDETLGEMFRVRASELNPDEDTFECRPHLSEQGWWECTWSVFTRPAVSPDPCMGDGSSGFQIIVNVSATGALESESFVCVAPG